MKAISSQKTDCFPDKSGQRCQAGVAQLAKLCLAQFSKLSYISENSPLLEGCPAARQDGVFERTEWKITL
jgi:hypothetical protein